MTRRERLWLIGILLIVSVTGCLSTKKVVQRTIYVPPGTPVQLASPASVNIHVGDSDSEFVIPEGWWCLPDPGE